MSSPFLDAFCSPWKKNWVESIHFIAIVLGIALSGWWALSTFEDLHAIENADQVLEKTQSEISKAKLELEEIRSRINGTISSNIELQVKRVDLEGSKIGLFITATIQNTGTVNLNMNWIKSPISIYKTKFKSASLTSTNTLKPYYYESLETDNEKFIQDIYLLVGAKKKLEFFVELDSGGLYYVAFKANVDEKLAKSLSENNKIGVWFASKYINVK